MVPKDRLSKQLLCTDVTEINPTHHLIKFKWSNRQAAQTVGFIGTDAQIEIDNQKQHQKGTLGSSNHQTDFQGQKNK